MRDFLQYHSGFISSSCCLCLNAVDRNCILAGQFNVICRECYTKIFEIVAENMPELLEKYLPKQEDAGAEEGGQEEGKAQEAGRKLPRKARSGLKAEVLA